MTKLITLSIQRVLQAIPILFMISLITFFLVEAADVDPEAALFPQQQSPLHLRYIRWAAGVEFYPEAGRPTSAPCLTVTRFPLTICDIGGGVMRAELGVSTATGQAVGTRILEAVPATFALAGLGFGLGTLSIIGLIRLSYSAESALVTQMVQLFAGLGRRISWFWLGLGLFFLVGVHQRWFTHLNQQADSAAIAAEPRLASLGLSTVIVALFWAALVCHLWQRDLIETRLNFRFFPSKHSQSAGIGRLNAQLASPQQAAHVAVYGAAFGQLLAATIIVEALFGWPGLGRLLLNATIQRDYPVVLGGIMVTSVVVLIAHWLVDLITTYQQLTSQPTAKPPIRRLKTSPK